MRYDRASQRIALLRACSTRGGRHGDHHSDGHVIAWATDAEPRLSKNVSHVGMDADPEELTGLDVCPDHGLQGSSGTTVPDPGMQLRATSVQYLSDFSGRLGPLTVTPGQPNFNRKLRLTRENPGQIERAGTGNRTPVFSLGS